MWGRIIEGIGVTLAVGVIVLNLVRLGREWKRMRRLLCGAMVLLSLTGAIMKKTLIAIVFVMGVVGLASLADAACTFGTNCYCDKVVPVAGAYYDANLLLCEDWEAPTLHDNTGVGITTASTRGSGGTNAYGPWYDDTGNATARGNNSYMVKKYSGCGAGCWTSGLPASPTVGVACGFATCYQAEYRSDNLWQGNTIGTGSGACIDVIKTSSSNANDEDAALGIPDTFGSTDSRGVWDGNQTFGYRVATNSAENENKPCGIVGTALYGRTVHTIGVTMAMAYGDNTASIGILAAPLKHEEFGMTGDTNFQEFWAVGNTGLNTGAGAGGFPFGAFRFNSSQSACNTALAAATVSVGQADCTSTALRIGTTSGVYQQSTNWPMGKWGCVRAYMTGMNTTSMTYWIKFYDGTTEMTVFSMTGFDAQNGLHNQGYNYNVWNTYSNASSPSVGTGGTTGPYRRWIDNYHVTEGTPVTCDQIGFVTAGGGGGGGGASISPILFIEWVGTVSAVLWHLSQHRSAIVRASLTSWRYVLALPSPKEMLWIYRYKRAVKRWQRAAPIMLRHHPSSRDEEVQS